MVGEAARFLYKCTDIYVQAAGRGIIWKDPTLVITWPVTAPTLSAKDRAYRTLKEMTDDLPSYRVR